MNEIQILVVLLSIGFLVLLGLTIALVMVLIKILNNIRHITEKAEATTDNLSAALKIVGKKVAPLAASTIAAAIYKKFRGKKD